MSHFMDMMMCEVEPKKWHLVDIFTGLITEDDTWAASAVKNGSDNNDNNVVKDWKWRLKTENLQSPADVTSLKLKNY